MIVPSITGTDISDVINSRRHSSYNSRTQYRIFITQLQQRRAYHYQSGLIRLYLA